MVQFFTKRVEELKPHISILFSVLVQ